MKKDPTNAREHSAETLTAHGYELQNKGKKKDIYTKGNHAVHVHYDTHPQLPNIEHVKSWTHHDDGSDVPKAGGHHLGTLSLHLHKIHHGEVVPATRDRDAASDKILKDIHKTSRSTSQHNEAPEDNPADDQQFAENKSYKDVLGKFGYDTKGKVLSNSVMDHHRKGSRSHKVRFVMGTQSMSWRHEGPKGSKSGKTAEELHEHLSKTHGDSQHSEEEPTDITNHYPETDLVHAGYPSIGPAVTVLPGKSLQFAEDYSNHHQGTFHKGDLRNSRFADFIKAHDGKVHGSKTFSVPSHNVNKFHKVVANHWTKDQDYHLADKTGLEFKP